LSDATRETGTVVAATVAFSAGDEMATVGAMVSGLMVKVTAVLTTLPEELETSQV
jgi:hypothetical protein